MEETQTLKVIIDSIGRYIIGGVVQETQQELQLKFPVILHVSPNPQTNQLQLQTFPLFFTEFVNPAAKESNVWVFNKSSIVTSDVLIDSKIVQQYNSLANPSVIVSPHASDSPVVKLFED